MKQVDILEDLKAHIQSLDERCSHWSCGITADPVQARQRASRTGTEWRCHETESELDARQIEVLLGREGCEVVPHPGGKGAIYVFVYLMASNS